MHLDPAIHTEPARKLEVRVVPHGDGAYDLDVTEGPVTNSRSWRHVATFRTWDAAARVARALEADAEAIAGDVIRRPRGLDAGELREALAEAYTHEFVPLEQRRRMERQISQLAYLTRQTREQVIAAAQADAASLEALGEMEGGS